MTTRNLGYEHTCPRCKATVHTDGCAPPKDWMQLTLFTLHQSERSNNVVNLHEQWAQPFASAVFCGPCAGAGAELLGLELVPKESNT